MDAAVIAIGSKLFRAKPVISILCVKGLPQGIQQLNLAGTVPVIFCVLTDNTLQQAKDRSGGELGNKGTEAAVAASKNGETLEPKTRGNKPAFPCGSLGEKFYI